MNKLLILIGSFLIMASMLPPDLSAQSFLPLYQGESGKLVEDLMIGGDIEDPDNYFHFPTDIAIDSQGNLFVLDSKGYCVKKFAPDGIPLATFGSKGEGPGEMIGAYRMAIDPDDNIVIFDSMNSKRFSFFDNQGEFLRSVSLTEFGFKNIIDFDFGTRGELYVRIHKSDYFRPNGKSIISVVRFDLETKREQPIDSLSISDMYSRQDDNNWQMATKPYHPYLLWAVSPSGNIITADSDSYRIRFYSPDLKLLHEHQHTGKKRKITEEDKEDYFESFKEDDTAEWLRKAAKFPERKPYFDRLYVDHEGYILLNIDDIDDDTQEYDVLDPEGQRINTIQLPHLGRTAIITDGYIYTTGSFQEEDFVVRRYRLEQGQ